jgi:hypothetical protein
MEPTSTSAPKSERKVHSHPSGDEYLADQISDARLALESTLDDLTFDAARAANLRRWIRRYPWAALGTALVAGFTLGHIVTKRRNDVATATTDHQPPLQSETGTVAAKSVAQATLSAATPRTGGWRTAVLQALFDILRLAVTQFVSASVRQAASRTSHPTNSPSRDDSAAAQCSPTDPSHTSSGDAAD